MVITENHLFNKYRNSWLKSHPKKQAYIIIWSAKNENTFLAWLVAQKNRLLIIIVFYS